MGHVKIVGEIQSEQQSNTAKTEKGLSKKEGTAKESQNHQDRNRGKGRNEKKRGKKDISD